MRCKSQAEVCTTVRLPELWIARRLGTLGIATPESIVATPLSDVFKLSGVPERTFVQPVEFESLLVNLQTPGRGLVIEGPSGIGKTTAITGALERLGMTSDVLRLSARRRDDVELIAELPSMGDLGIVVVDDFHRLDNAVRSSLADFLKTLADEEDEATKVIVVGINRAGETLISFARDLNNRIDILKFEANPDHKIEEVVSLGEQALNISIATKAEIVDAAAGSFYVAQMLCHETCVAAGVLEEQTSEVNIEVSFEAVLERVMTRLSTAFHDIALRFAHGTKLRREGRAPYLNVLRWLAEANEWAIDLDRERTHHPALKGSVGQVVEKGFLSDLIDSDDGISSVLHFEPNTSVLSAEDPQFVFYIRNLAWNAFAKQVGFLNIEFDTRYDIALSFAGTDRSVAERLFELFSEREVEVFYDKFEQHRILAEDVEEYLGPIYRSEASYVLVLLGPDYPKRIWTKFESDHFRERLGSGAVIPIWFTTAPPGLFDETVRVGGITFDPDGEVELQLGGVVETVCKRLQEDRL